MNAEKEDRWFKWDKKRGNLLLSSELMDGLANSVAFPTKDSIAGFTLKDVEFKRHAELLSSEQELIEALGRRFTVSKAPIPHIGESPNEQIENSKQRLASVYERHEIAKGPDAAERLAERVVEDISNAIIEITGLTSLVNDEHTGRREDAVHPTSLRTTPPSLRRSDIEWADERIRISKRWAKGEDGETKTEASDGFVPLHPMLADRLRAWQSRSPYPTPEDFLFPSERKKGKAPLYASTFVADYLRPAAIKAGVSVSQGQRFGLHNLRHSLSNWLVNKAKADPKTVQTILRHSKIQTTLDLYTQGDSDETLSAQGQFRSAVGLTQRVQ